jgi:hypothetical protein
MSIPSVAAPLAPAAPAEARAVLGRPLPAMRVLGITGAAAGLLFAAMAMWAHAAGIESGSAGIAAQINQGLFALATAGYVALGVGLYLARPGGSGRIARTFPALLAASWLAILVGGFLELFTSVSPDSDVLASIGGLAQAAALIGLGITVARAGRWSGWRRYWPLGTAVYVLGVLMAPSFFGVQPSWLVVALWALGYSGLGAALLVEALPAPRRPRSAVVLGALAVAVGAAVTLGVTAAPAAASHQAPGAVHAGNGAGSGNSGQPAPDNRGPMTTWDRTTGGSAVDSVLPSGSPLPSRTIDGAN